ncbi:hypothetical protein Cgig2_032477 [Carnegiea gigantea]|uniref:RING-type E3 ubiquitin transferase n=1 Tax=Carnegiea gigantea TaxID=171969 RepID=A0A9Q1QQJ2_9CARY|nr:hypothetical protein Cgig2_032477 [Carnegiea gigantea]
MVAKPPEHHHLPRQWGPAMAPAVLTTSSSFVVRHSPPSNLPIDFSPPLIAMVVVAAAAFLIVTYSRLISRRLFPPFHRLHRRYRRWRRRRRLRPHFPTSESESPPALYESSDGFYVYSPYGLDESVIKNIPLSIYKLPKSSKSLSSKLGFIEDEFHDCAVCLLEFEDGDYIRTLPVCSHSFHVDCIDIWLKSHATCPLCRSGVLVPPPLPESSLTPLMAARIRPSLDEGLLLESIFLGPLLEGPEQRSGEIQPAGPEDLLSPVGAAGVGAGNDAVSPPPVQPAPELLLDETAVIDAGQVDREIQSVLIPAEKRTGEIAGVLPAAIFLPDVGVVGEPPVRRIIPKNEVHGVAGVRAGVDDDDIVVLFEQDEMRGSRSVDFAGEVQEKVGDEDAWMKNGRWRLD